MNQYLLYSLKHKFLLLLDNDDPLWITSNDAAHGNHVFTFINGVHDTRVNLKIWKISPLQYHHVTGHVGNMKVGYGLEFEANEDLCERRKQCSGHDTFILYGLEQSHDMESTLENQSWIDRSFGDNVTSSVRHWEVLLVVALVMLCLSIYLNHTLTSLCQVGKIRKLQYLKRILVQTNWYQSIYFWN